MKTKNNFIGPVAVNLYIFACNIGLFRLGSTVNGLREELHHQPWQYYYTKVPVASTTTTYDVLSPTALIFILLLAIDITKMQHTAAANMPNGTLCFIVRATPPPKFHLTLQVGITSVFFINQFLRVSPLRICPQSLNIR